MTSQGIPRVINAPGGGELESDFFLCIGSEKKKSFFLEEALQIFFLSGRAFLKRFASRFPPLPPTDGRTLSIPLNFVCHMMH